MKKYIRSLKKYNWRNLYEALYNKNMKLIKDIISNDIMEDSSQKLYKRSVLFYVVDIGYRDVLEVILNKGNLVNILDISGYTLLMRACNKNDGYLDIVKLLLEKGASINEKSPYGETALSIACHNNNWKIAEFLLLHDAYDCKKEKESSLIYAIRNGQKNIIKLLIKYRKETVNRPYIGETPLMIACRYSNANVVNYLLKCGANINTVNINEENALYYAIYNKKYAREIAIVLIDNGIEINEDDKVRNFLEKISDIRLQTILNFRKNRIKGVKEFLNTLNEQDKKMCLIYLMISYFFNNRLDEVKLEFRELLRENSNVVHEIIKRCKKRNHNKEEKTSNYSLNVDIMMELMYNFCAIGNLDIVKSIVDIGVDINKKDKNGETLLITAIKEKNIQAIECLLKSGADINVKTSLNKGIISYAVNSGDMKIVNCLKDYIKNKNGSNEKKKKQKVSIVSNFERIKNNEDIKIYLS